MEKNHFFENAAFQNMSAEKLRFLMEFANLEKPNTSKDMLPFLMPFVNMANSRGIQFSQNETDFVIEHLKEQMSPQERKKADLIIQMMKSRKKQ